MFTIKVSVINRMQKFFWKILASFNYGLLGALPYKRNIFNR